MGAVESPLDQRPVEDDRRDRRPAQPEPQPPSRRHLALPRPVAAGARQDDRRRAAAARPDDMSAEARARDACFPRRPRPDSARPCGRSRPATSNKPRASASQWSSPGTTIGAAAAAGERAEPVEPVGPVAGAAHHADDDELRRRARSSRDRDRPRAGGRAGRGWRGGGTARRPVAPSAAAASAASSVSAADRKTMSPGGWPRSTAASPSSMRATSPASRCMTSRRGRRRWPRGPCRGGR